MDSTSDEPTVKIPPSNAEIGSLLDEVSDLLEEQGASPFRVRAYRRGAATVRGLAEPSHAILRREGLDGLIRLPGIGRSLAHSVDVLVHTGSLPMLDRLRGEHVAERLFATVADIGPKLAERIHDTLGIENLVDLEAAAADGRLGAVPGMGSKRIQAVREALAGRFHHASPKLSDPPTSDAPAIEELLGVDREYRQKVHRNQLPKISPRQYNPTGANWLPILHTVRADRHYTAMFSNSSLAHQKGTTRDWVVISRDDQGHSGCWTVITESRGKLLDHRMVRGREAECEMYYREHERTQLQLDFHDD